MKALIIGATGLVGSELLELMEEDDRVEKIELLSRRELELKTMKVVNHVIDFDKIEALPVGADLDTLFIAFGTTLKTAGSKKEQWKVDVDFPVKIMKLSKLKGIKRCVLISAMGVSSYSPFFYSRMKASLDKQARAIGFEKLVIIKPSVLEGLRKEERFGESVSVKVGNVIGKTGLIDKYRPVSALKVAKCMLQSEFELPNGIHEIHSGQIRSIARRYSVQKYSV